MCADLILCLLNQFLHVLDNSQIKGLMLMLPEHVLLKLSVLLTNGELQSAAVSGAFKMPHMIFHSGGIFIICDHLTAAKWPLWRDHIVMFAMQQLDKALFGNSSQDPKL